MLNPVLKNSGSTMMSGMKPGAGTLSPLSPLSAAACSPPGNPHDGRLKILSTRASRRERLALTSSHSGANSSIIRFRVPEAIDGSCLLFFLLFSNISYHFISRHYFRFFIPSISSWRLKCTVTICCQPAYPPLKCRTAATFRSRKREILGS